MRPFDAEVAELLASGAVARVSNPLQVCEKGGVMIGTGSLTSRLCCKESW